VGTRDVRRQVTPGKSRPSTTPDSAQVLLEKLQASERKYRRLFEAAQDGILLLDTKTGEITDVNPFLLDLLGYPHEEIVGKKLCEIGLFADRKLAKQAFEKLLKDRYIRYEDLPLETATGARIHVEFVGNVYSVDGKEVIQGNIRDITQREAAEAARRSEEMEKDLALAAGGLGIWKLDLVTGTIQRSLRHDRIFGYPTLLPEWTFEMFLSHVVAEDRGAVAERFEEALSSKTDWDLECRIRRKDGELRWIWAAGKPELNERHELAALFGIVQDITERKQAEALLAASELKYRQVVENAGQAICVVQGARIVFANPMALTMIGYSTEKVLATPFLEFIHPDDRDVVLDRHAQRMRSEEVPPVYSFRLIREDGSVRWVELSAVLIDWQGEPATLNFLSDITQRALAERENEILARFPTENPDPVMRVTKDGEILYANPASEPLLRLWKTARSKPVPADWQERVSHALRHGVSETRELECGDCVYSILIVPIHDSVYANLYGRDITEHRKTELEREGLLQRQTALNRITLSLGAATDLRGILRTLHAEVRTLLDANGFSVFWYHKDTGLITALYMVDQGVERDVSTFPPSPFVPGKNGIQSQVLRTGEALNVPNWIERERATQAGCHIGFDGRLGAPPEDCTKSAVLVPMMVQGKPVGLLHVQSNRLNAYSDDDVALLVGLANVAAISIQDEMLVEEVRHGLEGTIEALADMTEIRDPYTSGHQRRVSQLACAIAEKMGLAKKEVVGLRVSGLLHDVGKISVPAEILSKPTALAPPEFSLVKEHVRIGFDILKGVAFPWPIAEMVLGHHERLDGSGYPQGLEGEAICLGARILAVADVVEAMASHRPYRPALGIDAALQEIREHQGKLYDSTVVEACVQLFADGFEFT
jgi:PAS domain S-box-containing protein